LIALLETQHVSESGVIETGFYPLEVVADNDHNYFPVEIGIRLDQKHLPEEWPDELDDVFWKSLYAV